LPALSLAFEPVPTTSLFSAKIHPSGIAAPMRFSIMGWGSATTLALITRLHAGGGAGLFAAAELSADELSDAAGVAVRVAGVAAAFGVKLAWALG
jgi:hypothetical protein